MLIGRLILLWKPEGIPSIEDNEGVSRFIFNAIDEVFGTDDTFYAFFDYSGLRNPPIANRLRVLQNLQETAARLKNIYFYGMNRRTATIVRMAVYLSGLKNRIAVCRDYREAVELVRCKESGRSGGTPPPLYVPQDVSRLLGIISSIIWNRDYSVSVPELSEAHPLAEIYNAVDVMRNDLRRLDAENSHAD